jgi:hypothetical protein
MKRILLAAVAFLVGWIWGFLSLRALLERSRRRLSMARLVDSAAERTEHAAARLAAARETARERAREKEKELRRRFGLE